MNIRVEKACGIDIHQEFLVATMLDLAGTKDTRRFSICIEDLLNLREWLLDTVNGGQKFPIFGGIKIPT